MGQLLENIMEIDEGSEKSKRDSSSSKNRKRVRFYKDNISNDENSKSQIDLIQEVSNDE